MSCDLRSPAKIASTLHLKAVHYKWDVRWGSIFFESDADLIISVLLFHLQFMQAPLTRESVQTR